MSPALFVLPRTASYSKVDLTKKLFGIDQKIAQQGGACLKFAGRIYALAVTARDVTHRNA